ncbi:MAG: hypothetical protein ACOY5U_13685 [Pseudomonadota bacterium]
MPGPAHLPQTKDEIGLSADPMGQIRAIFARMDAEAIAEGARLIDAEARPDAAFRDRSVTGESLKAMLAESEAIRERLRCIRLSPHLLTPALLSADQIGRCNA